MQEMEAALAIPLYTQIPWSTVTACGWGPSGCLSQPIINVLVGFAPIVPLDLVAYTSAIYNVSVEGEEGVLVALQVLPVGEGKTQVLMDYYVHPSKASPFVQCLLYLPDDIMISGKLSYVNLWGDRTTSDVVVHVCSKYKETLEVQVNDKEWIDAVVIGEDIVQREDMHMCDLVQGGLASPAYDVGRLAATLCTTHALFL